MAAVDLDALVPEVVRRWVADAEADRSRTIDATVVSADISGFTRLAERLAEEGIRRAGEALTDAINLCFEPMIAAAADLGGDIVKFGGDAILVLFDGPRAEARGCLAADRMMEVIAAIDVGGGTQLSMTVGIASGRVDLLLGGTTRRELIVLGTTVDECLGLEGHADPGEILISAATAAAIPPSWITELDDGTLALADAHPIDADPIHAHETPTELATTEPVPTEPTPTEPAPTEPTSTEMATSSLAKAADLTEVLGAELIEAAGAYADTAGEVRVVTVAFVMVPTVGRDAADVLTLIDHVDELCRRYRITLLTADAHPGATKLVLVAGAPTSYGDEDDAMLQAVTDVVNGSPGDRAQAGVNRGAVFVGFLGSERRRTFTVMGDAVNLAARLMARAEPGTVLASDPVLARTRLRYRTVERPPLLVRGRVEPVTVHSVGAALGPAQRGSPAPRLVGRATELAELREVFSRARQGRGEVVDVRGEAGVGKSRLVDELLDGLPVGVLVVDLGAATSSARQPWSVVRGFLRGLAGVTTTGPAGGDELRSWLTRVATATVPLAPLIAAAFDVDVEPTPTADAVEPEFRLERAVDVLTELVDDALPAGTVIVSRNAGAADEASNALLRRLAERTAERSWLVITTAQELSPTTAHSKVVELGPLPPEAAVELVDLVADLPEQRRRDIAARSAGNPLFAIELAQISELGESLPDSIEGVATARIDRLGHDRRSVVRAAAALGVEFPLSLLTAVVAELVGDRWQETMLDGLSPLLQHDDGVVRFNSPAIRDAAYSGLSARRRADIHRCAARALLRLGGDNAELARHFAGAGDHRRTWHHSCAAGRQAADLGAMRAAVGHFRRALEAADHLDDLDPDAVRTVNVELHLAAGAAGLRNEAVRAGERAAVLTADLGARAELQARVLRARAEGDGSHRAARDTVAAWLDEVEDGPAGAGERAVFGSALAGFHFRLGSLDEAAACAARALDDARHAGQLRAAATASLILQNVAGELGDPRRFELGTAAIEAAGAADDPALSSMAHSNAGVDLANHGDWDAAIEHYHAAADIAARRGDTVRLFFARLNEAVVRADQGRWDEARPVLDELRRATASDASGYAHALSLRELGRLEAHAGRATEARRWLHDASSWFAAAGDRNARLETEVALVECLLAEGRSDDVLAAEPHLRTLAGSDPLPVHLVGIFDGLVGYALLQRGQPDNAMARLQRAADDSCEVARFTYARALTGCAEAEAALGRGRASRRTHERAAVLLDELGVVSLPYVPLPH